MVKQGYKQTEIGVIPEDWEVFDIQELINNNAIIGHLDGNHGALYPKSYEFVEDGIPYVGANALINGKIDFNKVKYLTKERANTFQKGISYPKDLLFAHNATVGPVAYIGNDIEKIILSTTLTYFRCNESKIFSKYLLYEFQTEHFIKQYSSVMSQSTRNQVPITAQRKFKIILPPLAEQEAIATALSDADAWIDNLEQLIAKKRLIKQGTMQELLTPRDDWEVKKLGEVVRIAKSGGTPLSSNKAYYDGSIPFLSISDMTEQGKYLRWTSNSISQLGLENSASWIVPENSIIYSMYASVGFVSINKIKLATSQAVLNLILKDEYCLEFIYYTLVSIQTKILKFVGEGTQKNLNAQAVKDFDLHIPILTEQERIATILSDMDAELEALEQQLAKAQQIKQGMMQELLTGRVRLV